MDFYLGLGMKYIGLSVAGIAVAMLLDAVLAVRYPDYAVTGRRAGNRLRASKTSILFTLSLIHISEPTRPY